MHVFIWNIWILVPGTVAVENNGQAANPNMVLCWHSDARPLDLCGPSLLRTCGSMTFFLFVLRSLRVSYWVSSAVTRFVAQPASVSNMVVVQYIRFLFSLSLLPFVLSNNLDCCQARANDYTHLNRCSTLVFLNTQDCFFFFRSWAQPNLVVGHTTYFGHVFREFWFFMVIFIIGYHTRTVSVMDGMMNKMMGFWSGCCDNFLKISFFNSTVIENNMSRCPFRIPPREELDQHNKRVHSFVPLSYFLS